MPDWVKKWEAEGKTPAEIEAMLKEKKHRHAEKWGNKSRIGWFITDKLGEPPQKKKKENTQVNDYTEAAPRHGKSSLIMAKPQMFHRGNRQSLPAIERKRGTNGLSINIRKRVASKQRESVEENPFMTTNQSLTRVEELL